MLAGADDADDAGEDDSSEGDVKKEGNEGFRGLRHQLQAQLDAQPGVDPVAESAAVRRMLEEYYRLDYEDVVAGIRTRFHYQPVLAPPCFGSVRHHTPCQLVPSISSLPDFCFLQVLASKVIDQQSMCNRRSGWPSCFFDV